MKTDFLIIGGGIAGVSAAARLSHLGTVTVLEAEDHLAYHTSGRSAALFEPSYGLAPVVALSRATEDHLRHADGGVLSQRGLLLLGNADQAGDFDRDRDALNLDRISYEEAGAMVPVLRPDRVAHAAHGAHAWDIDTDRLIQNFARECRQHGGQIVTGARVTGITRAAGVWEVATGSTTYKAQVLVNAAGAWADDIATLAGVAPVGLSPLRRSMARIPAPGGHDVSKWPMIFGAGETWYAKPDAGALIVSPAEEDPSFPHDAWADDMVLAEGLARYEAMVTEPVTRILASWAGLRTFAPDRVLVIGPDPAHPAFVWLAGQGGYGFQTSAAASQLAADLISGAQSVLDPGTIAALTPKRLR